ncbi:MAG: hypothetical protein ABIR18_08000, partial [Chitinophagaceae bacterium]
MSKALKFINQTKTDFLPILKSRVEDYFKEKKLSRYANSLMIFKTIFFISLAVLLYLMIITSLFSLYVRLGGAILLGMTMAFIGFNVCHDALHGAYSS